MIQFRDQKKAKQWKWEFEFSSGQNPPVLRVNPRVIATGMEEEPQGGVGIRVDGFAEKVSRRSYSNRFRAFPTMADQREEKSENRVENADGDVRGGGRSVPTHRLNFPTVSPSPETEAPTEFHGRSVWTGPTAAVSWAWR